MRFYTSRVCYQGVRILSELTLALLIICIAVREVSGDELVYRPVNPNFGGNPFNGAYLLGSAEAQKQFSAPDKSEDPIDKFSEEIQRALLSRISREIADAILGEDAKESGTFSVGSTIVDFQQIGGQVVINISDAASGGQTTIELPLPQY